MASSDPERLQFNELPSKEFRISRNRTKMKVKIALVSFAVCAAQFQVAHATSPPNQDDRSMHHSKHGYHRRFDNIEKWVQKFDDPKRDKWQKPDEVIKALNIGANDKIVDIGAGTGYFSLRIAKAHPSATVYAADIEPNMVAHLKQRSKQMLLRNHVAIKVGVSKVRLPDKVNLVLIVDTYHHIDDRVSYFGALKKQLAENARIAIIDFTAESPEGPPPEHRISKQDLENEMKHAGYKLDQDISLLPNQYFLMFKSETGSSAGVL